MSARSIRRSGAVAGAVAVLVLCAFAGAHAVAQASFGDRAELRSTVGSAAFEIALLDEQALIRDVARDGVHSMEFTQAEQVVPGSTVQVPFTVANNSRFRVAPVLALEASSPDIERLDELLRVTVEERDACTASGGAKPRTLIGDAGDFANGATLSRAGSLAGSPMPARSGDAQRAGAAYSGGDPACRSYTASLHLRDDDALRALSAGTWTVTLTIEGRSAE